MNINRRFFILGTAAAISATSIPAFAEPLISPAPLRMRKVRGINIFPIRDVDGIRTVDITVDGNTILKWQLNSRSMLFWGAPTSGDEIIRGADQTFEIGHEGPPFGQGFIELHCKDYYGDDKEPVRIVERHYFQSTKPVECLAITARDAERLARFAGGLT
jgi:hypothetical protein